MGNKQTAVDFLEESIHLHCLINDKEDVMIDYNTLDKLFMKSRAMEKEQIISAYAQGVLDEGGLMYDLFEDAILYFQENYGI